MNKDIIVVTWGGIGDLLLCTPTIRAIKESYPSRRLIVYCVIRSHQQTLLNNPYIDSIRLLKPISMWRYPRHLFYYLFNRTHIKHYHLNFQHIPLTWIYNKHVTEIVPDIFADLHIELQHKKVDLFFTRKEEEKAREALSAYKNPILLHTYSRSSKNHQWPVENWEMLVKEMPELTFIQVGHSDEPYARGALDWRGKTTVRDTFCLLKYCTSFVGVDSSLAHATNAVDLPGVVLFGDSPPALWGHTNNINIFKGIRCSPCYYYVWNDPCPYGHECMRLITVEEVKTALHRQIERRYN